MKAALEAVEAARRKAQEVGVPHEKELDEVDDLDDAEEPTLVVEREPMVAAGDDQEVDETYTFSSYKEARFRVPTTVDIPDVPISVMNDIVEKIIRVEAPIHVDEVVQRVRLLWGLGRAGRLIREAVVAAVANFERSEDSVPQGDGFLMHRNAKLRIRSRNGVDSSTLRKPEYLPPAEIDAAIVDLTKRCHGLQEKEVAKVVADAFGFGSLRQKLRETIEGRVVYLVEAGRLERTGQGNLRVRGVA